MVDQGEPEPSAMVDCLLKEEFVQNYLQYRWLDETRSKLVDRIFIIVSAAMATRLQFAAQLENSLGWLFILHVSLILATGTLAFSIVRFRRQQRGHGAYINSVRDILFKEHRQFTEYREYLKGKPVFSTLGVETLVVLLAVLAPFTIRLDAKVLQAALPPSLWVQRLVFVLLPSLLVLVGVWFVAIPYLKYNFCRSLRWEKD